MLSRRTHDSVATQLRLVEDIHSKVSTGNYLDSRECLRALFITDPLVDRKEIENRKDNLMEDSCEWILSNQSFREAMDSPQTELLWIHGEPGKGKTMIAMFLVDTISARISNTRQEIVSYFFCDNTTDKRNTALNALRSVLHQILKQSTKNVLLEDFENQGLQMFLSVEAVWMSLMRVLQASNLRTVHIVIDGLDECDRHSLDSFLGLIRTYAEENSKGNCIVKWVFTSRNEVAIREHLNLCWEVDLEANSAQVAKAVDAFIDLKVDELAVRKNYNPGLKEWVIETLREKAEGTFLWVALACSELRKRTVSSINTRLVLGKLPPGLSRLYARILDQVTSNDIEEMVDIAVEILRSVTVAIRPMSFGDLAVMAGLPDDARMSNTTAREYAELCGSFLTFREDHVFLVHQSAKDYLLRHQEEQLYPHGIITEHEKATHRCLQYVCRDWQRDLIKKGNKTGPADFEVNLMYPLVHWIDHSNMASKKLLDTYTLDIEFFRSNSELRRSWLHYFQTNQRQPDLTRMRLYKFSALHISAVCDTCWVAEKLLEDRLEFIDVQDFWGMAPLHWAVQCRNTAMAELLLQKGADPNNKGRIKSGKDGPRRGTPLGLAVSYNNIEIAKLLLQHGAHINGTDHSSMTPLTWSITKNFPTLTSFLIQQGANVNLRNPISKTPLHIAAALGNETIARMLLDAGALVNARDIEAYSPVHESAYRGHNTVTGLLLAKGASKWDAEQAQRWAMDVSNKEKSDASTLFGTGMSTLKSWASAPSRTSPSKAAGFGLLGAVEPGTTVPALRSWGFQSPSR